MGVSRLDPVLQFAGLELVHAQTKASGHVKLPVCFCTSAALFAVRQFVDVQTASHTVHFCVSVPRVCVECTC